MPLVDTTELASMLGMEFSVADHARAEQVLTMATGEVESYCTAVGLTYVEHDPIYVRGTWARSIELPKPPVHEVHSVHVNDDEVFEFDFTYHGRLISPDGWGGPDAEIRVEYDHGLVDLPDVVKSVILTRATRSFVNPYAVMQSKMGADYSISYAADSEAVTGLNRSERRALARYRRGSR